jgi:pyruvate decarboxylase
MKPEINRLVQASKIPTLTMPSGAGMIDHSHRSYFGVHAGPVGKIDTMPLMNSADVVVNIGGMFSDTQSLGWSTLPPPEKTITITSTSITFPNSTAPTPINARRLLTKLAVAVQPASRNRSLPDIPDFRALRPPSVNPSERIDQDSLYLRLNPYLRPNDTILLANSTPIIGGRDFILPPGAQVIASGVAFSVGHMLPASLGAALAQRSRPPERRGRTILFVGDGSLQATVQEIGTVIRYRLDLTIFILNNGGYAYERHIHGLEKEYNDIASWRYTDLPKAFGAPVGDKEYPVETHVVETWGDLERLVGDEEFCSGRGLRLVDVRVGKYDVPEKFKPVFRAAAEKL